MTRLTVSVGGMDFKLMSEDSEEHVRKVARYADKQIEDIQSKYPSLSFTNCVLLALMNVSDELHKARADYDALDSRISQLRDMPRAADTSPKAPVKRPFETTAK